MSKKLDKKSLIIKQAMLCGFVVEIVVGFKVVSHYTIVVWNTVLSIPHIIGGAFSSVVEQVAHVFGA